LACGPELNHGGRRFRAAGARGGGRRGEVRGGADVRDRPGRERMEGRRERSVRKREREGVTFM
jgi:hypothetical protein